MASFIQSATTVLIAAAGGILTALVWFVIDRLLFGNFNDMYYYSAVVFAFMTGWLSKQ